DYSLLDRLNIQCDTIVINQGNDIGNEIFDYKGHRVEWISVDERGLSKSRNLALSKATGDICVLVDDDEILRPGYPEIIKNAFSFYPEATV
ncbi:glycosyltransferase family 2 protein, partial [Veillonella sp. ZSJB6]|uniref:glycosyltransferase family 2 protein n=1 Tax=Veillonella sp. ZSJB6 TaxID=3451359 RepID=UPI003EE7A903